MLEAAPLAYERSTHYNLQPFTLNKYHEDGVTTLGGKHSVGEGKTT